MNTALAELLMAGGTALKQLEAKQKYYAELDSAFAESDDEPDAGRRASAAAMRKVAAREAESSASSKSSCGLPRSASETNLAKDPLLRQREEAFESRYLASGSKKAPALQTGATFSAAPSKPMAPVHPPASAIPRSSGAGKRKRDWDVNFMPQQQQIFRGLHFYFFPNDDTNLARRMRITKALEFGATWQRDFNEWVTHVVVDKAMDHGLLLRFLKLEALPENVALVAEHWQAECISYRMVLDPAQKSFWVKGAPEPKQGSTSTAKPGMGKDPQGSGQSNKSLELKPANRALMAKQPETQRTTTDEPASSPQTTELFGGQRHDQQVDQKVGVRPGTAAQQASHAESNPEFEAAIRKARELQHVPLEQEDDEDSHERPISSGGQPDTDDEDAVPKSSGLPLVQQRKTKYQRLQDKFQCMQSHTGDEPGNPNAGTIEILQQMADYYGQIGDEWRIRAYRKAITTLRKHPTKVWTRDEALALPQIGSRLATKIEEIAFTSRLRRLDNARAEPSDQVLQTFMGVYGAGFTKASEWVAAGYRTLDELIEKADLTENQRIGIEHFSDFKSRIPRAEVARHGSIVRKALHKIDPAFEVIIGGSYRRGSHDSGDIDCIITRPDTGPAHLRNVILGQLIPKLMKSGFLVASLAMTSRDDGSKWHGASQLPSAASPNSNPWRRIDFLLVPSAEIGAALIYFTGNDIFNRSMRLLASTKGMRLNQRGLYKDCLRGKGRVKVTEGTLVEGKNERRIFEALGVPWREPWERIC